MSVKDVGRVHSAAIYLLKDLDVKEASLELLVGALRSLEDINKVLEKAREEIRAEYRLKST